VRNHTAACDGMAQCEAKPHSANFRSSIAPARPERLCRGVISKGGCAWETQVNLKSLHAAYVETGHPKSGGNITIRMAALHFRLLICPISRAFFIKLTTWR
jgi:hypothetical protein